MYIAVLDEFPDFMTPTLVAHAVLQHHIETEDDFKFDYLCLYTDWLMNSFKKVVLQVSQKEFDKIALLDNVTLTHENNTLDRKKSCAVVVVGDTIPNVLKFAKMWKPLQSVAAI